MKNHLIRRAVAALVLSVSVVGGAMGGEFFKDIDDLPLMTGLIESADGSMIFDSGNGRIVESFAEGKVTKQAVLDFYTATLPQLGWRQDAPGAFRREDEVLKLAFPGIESISGAGQPMTVRFTLSPAKN